LRQAPNSASGHDPERWPEFCRRYTKELQQNTAALDDIRQLARSSVVTLLFAAHDEQHNAMQWY
jgi:uncharacterized protein YeaO (DUF488 family)